MLLLYFVSVLYDFVKVFALKIMNKLLVLIGVTWTSVYIGAAPGTTAQVEVRAVLINCAPDLQDGQSVLYENEATRFEREELFKHSVLSDCKKKIALTVKIASDPDLNSGDEYIPIDHVFQGPTKRVRLLNPYVLRLRRDPPVQAYKLKKIDTICGTLAQDIESRIKRHFQPLDLTAQQLNMLKAPETSENSVTDSIERDQNELINTDDETSRAPVGVNGNVIGDAVSVSLNDKTPNEIFSSDYKPKPKKPEPYEVNTKIEWPEEVELITYKVNPKRQNEAIYKEPDKDYDMFEIGNADLWYTIQVQLFEKLTTPEGRTAWNDLTKGKTARVSSLCSEWTGQDISILYKSSEWVPRESFALPTTSMCLLAPVYGKATASLSPDENAGQYVVVPREDIVGLPLIENFTISTNSTGKTRLRRVIIRSSRALIGGDGVKVNIVKRAEDQFLTLLHRKPYHAQIELEARADGNQLVHVGSSGRIMTAVSDNSRRTRTVITVQVTNTGLAAARFKVVTRDCNPELPENLNEKINEEDASFIILLPKQTQTTHINVPAEIPADVAHCSVALINNDQESVAVRDVTIRRGDRCFCVWHCECVCLGVDPKLLCREMAEARQLAAGLSPRERTQLVRSVCYHDILSLNFCLTAFGVLLTLLFFGLVKACLGVGCRWVGSWGLSLIVQMPRRLDHYYEPGLLGRAVIYDDEGWPLHPDTMQRTVRLVSLPMEFVLNTIFFVVAPCVLIYEIVTHLCSHCKISDRESNWSLNRNPINKNYSYSSRENIVQSSGGCRRRRGAKLQRWMTPEAERLTSRVMQHGVPTHASMIRDYMRPLLCEEICRGDTGTGAGVSKSSGRDACVNESCGDSDVDDTEYVLMQMQKSRDSLVKNQRKLIDSAGTVTNKQ